jgi:hypothetical protein
MTLSLYSVTPAKAGAQLKSQTQCPGESWIPAFAGMTVFSVASESIEL